MDVFENETLDVLNWFKEKNALIEIDGSGTPQEVHQKIA